MITWGTATAVLAAPLVFLLPGWALLSLLLPPEHLAPEHRPDAASWLILATGVTLALVPVGLLFLDLIGLRVGAGVVLAGLALSAAVILWRRGPVWRAWWRRSSSPLAPDHNRALRWPDLSLVALLAVTALVLGLRLWVVRGINVGFWGDSYQHTMIVQLMLDNGGLFESWAPYAPLESFTYHFGFHSHAALFQWATGWLTGNPTPRTVVLTAQFLNVLGVLALYPLAVRLSGGRKWAGVVAVLVAGLVTTMPMYYVNWGRYTQLAGQAILPAALWLTLEAVEQPGWGANRVGRFAVAVLVNAGLGLTHYRVLTLYVTFFPIYLAYQLLRSGYRRRSPDPARTLSRSGTWLDLVTRVAVVGLLAALLIAPWFWRLSTGFLPANLASYQQGVAAGTLHQEFNELYSLMKYSPGALMWLALAGAAWAAIRRQPICLIAVWAALNLDLANAYRLGVLDTGLANNATIILGLYLPTAILLGYLADALLGLLAARRRLAELLALVLVVLIGVLGARAQADTLDPAFQLVTPADEQAMAWIREHTPPDAKFLVNAFFAFGGHYVVGSDAGWWIPLLAGRANTVPPLNYSSEAAGSPDYREQVSALMHRVEQGGLDDPETVRFLQAQGITHVFLGRVGGPLLDAEMLRRSLYYDLVYDQDGVLILALKPLP